MEKWPNFFLVGAPRCGTSSMYEYLKSVPDIFMSQIKEPNFFCKVLIPDNDPFLPSIRKKDEYLHLFQNVKNEIIVGEGTTHYLADPEAAKLIHQVSPNAKILISIRDPIERAFSHFLWRKNVNWYKNNFIEHIKKEIHQGIEKNDINFFLKHGLYSKNIKRYLDIFGKEQVKVIVFEEWQTNIKKTVDSILYFLAVFANVNLTEKKINAYQAIKFKYEISEKILKNKKIVRISRSIIPKFGRNYIETKILKYETKKPNLQKEEISVLKNVYGEDVKKLEILLGRKFPWSNFK